MQKGGRLKTNKINEQPVVSHDQKMSQLKEKEKDLRDKLNDLPTAVVSDLMTKIPDLKLSSDLQEEVYFYREEQERKLVKANKGDTLKARKQLADQLMPAAEAKNNEIDSDNSSSSDEQEDENILGKRTSSQLERSSTQVGADLSQICWDHQ